MEIATDPFSGFTLWVETHRITILDGDGQYPDVNFESKEKHPGVVTSSLADLAAQARECLARHRTERPVIKSRAPRKSITPSDDFVPPIEALNEGESEIEDEDEPQPDPLRGRCIRADLPVEALGFALRDYQHIKRKMNHSHCTNCVACSVECTHQGPGLKCKECKSQGRSGCSHPLSYNDFLNVAEDLFPISWYAPSELDHIIIDFNRAHEDLLALEVVYTRAQHRFALTAHVLGDWMQGILASYGPGALPGMNFVPEPLRDTWGILPMLDIPIGFVPDSDHRDFLNFLHDLDKHVQADEQAKSSGSPRPVKKEQVVEEEDEEDNGAE
ncbi:hypothetical protein C8R45DRAFT_1090810 [Mycena sanguinolenta]|nr:hypothetical protein C8R45DRAFT_1090810 [Mycena sanguinolenta]